MSLSIHTVYSNIFKAWRRKRFGLFLRLIKPKPSETLLDVGGYPAFWTSWPQPVQRIDALNLHEISWKSGEAPDHHIKCLVGDGCCLPMPDRSYGIAFSNSVIEHVGSWERQQKFASEIRRIAETLWVQTPAYECPIEPHYLAPFVHYLPRRAQKKLLRWFTLWGWLEHPTREQVAAAVDSTRLLRKSEMLRLFPDCEIVTERLLWIVPKSYIAVRRPS
jgi:hypothetical protein